MGASTVVDNVTAGFLTRLIGHPTTPLAGSLRHAT